MIEWSMGIRAARPFVMPSAKKHLCRESVQNAQEEQFASLGQCCWCRRPCAPAARSGLSLDGVRLHTSTSCPAGAAVTPWPPPLTLPTNPQASCPWPLLVRPIERAGVSDRTFVRGPHQFLVLLEHARQWFTVRRGP